MDTANSSSMICSCKSISTTFFPLFAGQNRRLCSFPCLLRVSIIAAQPFFPVDAHAYNKLRPDFYSLLAVPWNVTGNHPMYDEYIYIYTLVWIAYTFQWILFGYGFGLDKSRVSPEEAPRCQGGITGCCSTLLNNPIDVAWRNHRLATGHQKSLW